MVNSIIKIIIFMNYVKINFGSFLLNFAQATTFLKNTIDDYFYSSSNFLTIIF